MERNFEHQYTLAKRWANQHRPQVERRARTVPGQFLVNLAHEWRLLLMREVLS